MSSPTPQTSTSTPAEYSAAKDPVVPIWLIVVLFMLVYWGAVYFDEHGGGFEPKVYTPYASAQQLKTYQVGGPPPLAELGEAVYNRPTCVTCHQGNGQGQPGTFPPLAGSDFVNDKEPGRIIRIVLQGFQGSGLVVSGKPFPTTGQMVPWHALSDDDIAAVITYVRQAWGNKAPPVTPERVRAVRAKVPVSHPPFTPDEIMKVSPSD